MGAKTEAAPHGFFSRFRVENQPAGLAIRPHQTTRKPAQAIESIRQGTPGHAHQIGGMRVSAWRKQRGCTLARRQPSFILNGPAGR